MKKLTREQMRSIVGGNSTIGETEGSGSACALCPGTAKKEVCCEGTSCSAEDGVGCSCASSAPGGNIKRCND